MQNSGGKSEKFGALSVCHFSDLTISGNLIAAVGRLERVREDLLRRVGYSQLAGDLRVCAQGIAKLRSPSATEEST